MFTPAAWWEIIQNAKKEAPMEIGAVLPKLTAYEKFLFLLLFVF